MRSKLVLPVPGTSSEPALIVSEPSEAEEARKEWNYREMDRLDEAFPRAPDHTERLKAFMRETWQ
jgi:hypothetical protein